MATLHLLNRSYQDQVLHNSSLNRLCRVKPISVNVTSQSTNTTRPDQPVPLTIALTRINFEHLFWLFVVTLAHPQEKF